MKNASKYCYAPIASDITYQHKITSSDPTYSYHRHNAYEIYLFIQGSILCYIEHTCYQLEPGDLIIINPQEMHRVVCLDHNKNKTYERITINIKKSVLDNLSSSHTNLSSCFDYHPTGQNNLIHLNQHQIAQFIELSNQIEQALSSHAYGHDILTKCYLSQLLVMINPLYHNSSFIGQNIMPKLIREVMEYIEAHLTERLTLDQISEAFYLNGTYISRQFKNHTGLSLSSYILDQRIALAKSLLYEGKNVSEACYESGFSDYANFIRSFKNIVGISPGKFKKADV